MPIISDKIVKMEEILGGLVMLIMSRRIRRREEKKS
jgi:hypothetical protein